LKSWEEINSSKYTPKSSTNEDDLEVNSGVEFPGTSLENFVGSTMNFEK
jgi:hypothetical protein